jgi:hypothetical protein
MGVLDGVAIDIAADNVSNAATAPELIAQTI